MIASSPLPFFVSFRDSRVLLAKDIFYHLNYGNSEAAADVIFVSCKCLPLFLEVKSSTPFLHESRNLGIAFE